MLSSRRARPVKSHLEHPAAHTPDISRLYTTSYFYDFRRIFTSSIILHCLRSVLLTHPELPSLRIACILYTSVYSAPFPIHFPSISLYFTYLKALPVKCSPATTMPYMTPNKACAAGGLVYDWIAREGRDATKEEDALAAWTVAGFQSSPERVLLLASLIFPGKVPGVSTGVFWCVLGRFIGTTQLKVNVIALQSYCELRHPNGISTIEDLHPEEFDNAKAVGWECRLQLKWRVLVPSTRSALRI